MKSLKYIFLTFFVSAATLLSAQAQDEAVNKVVTQYLAIKNDLAADNSKAANADAKTFTEALKQVQPGKLTDAEKKVWTKYAEKLRFDGDHISESAAITHQREHFGNLSTNMYAVIKAFKTNKVTLYQQYCPMERKSWLSESSSIKNPYLGKQMIDCGRTTETLKAK